tara:strand:+ start:2190 stop:2408 length:219 start_codon:yes stop_codon:yes gene_type:complete
MLAARQPSFSPLDGVELGCQHKVRFSKGVNLVREDNGNNPTPSQLEVGMMALLFTYLSQLIGEFQSRNEVWE